MEKNKMSLPRMILFDYGGTILYEQQYTPINGIREIYPHITANPLGLTVEEINTHVRQAYEKMLRVKAMGAEVHQYQFMRIAYESLGLEFDLPCEELEIIEWNAASPGVTIPYAAEMLEHLHQKGIRTGVISNIGWSGNALTERINSLLPDNHFEFIIASSEYGVRKPDRMLFEVALRKASLMAEEVWFCGDTPSADIVGAHSAGIFPVLYRGEPKDDRTRFAPLDDIKDIDYLAISDWRELIEMIENM